MLASDPSLAVTSPGVLANDTDQNNDPLTAVKVTDPTNGTVVFNANGSFTYTPDLGYLGSDSFTYEAVDGVVDSNIATVNLSVTPRLSVPTNLTVLPGGTVIVPVNIDNPDPQGSGGLFRQPRWPSITIPRFSS